MSINKVAQDYGHGVGQDRGAVGIVPEENVINNIASNCDVMFQARDVEVVWTRPTATSSVNDSLNQRCTKANTNNVDLFISHHANMGKGNGHEIWVMGLGGQSEEHARKVDRALTALGSNSRGVKVGNLAVLRGTNAPAILIEYFFLDNQSNVDFYNGIGAYVYAEAVVGAVLGIAQSDNKKEEVLVQGTRKDDIVYGTTTVNTLNIRDEASVSSVILGTLSKNTNIKVNLQYSQGDWYNIYYGEHGGFVHKDYVSIVGQEPQLPNVIVEENPVVYGTVKVGSLLNVRNGASTSSSIIGQLSNGEKVKIDKRYSTKDWYSIYYGNSGGFIHRDYVLFN